MILAVPSVRVGLIAVESHPECTLMAVSNASATSLSLRLLRPLLTGVTTTGMSRTTERPAFACRTRKRVVALPSMRRNTH